MINKLKKVKLKLKLLEYKYSERGIRLIFGVNDVNYLIDRVIEEIRKQNANQFYKMQIKGRRTGNYTIIKRKI